MRRIMPLNPLREIYMNLFSWNQVERLAMIYFFMLQGDSPASSSSSQASKKQPQIREPQQPPPQPPTPATRNGGSSRSGTLKRVAFKDEQTVHEDDGASSTRCDGDATIDRVCHYLH